MLNYFAKKKIEKLSKEELLDSIDDTKSNINQLNSEIGILEENKKALLERNNQRIADYQTENAQIKEKLKTRIEELSEEIGRVNELIKAKTFEKDNLINDNENKVKLLEEAKLSRQKTIDEDFKERAQIIDDKYRNDVALKEKEFVEYRNQLKTEQDTNLEKIKNDLSELNKAYDQIENDNHNDLDSVNHDYSFSCEDELNYNKELNDKKDKILETEMQRDQTRQENLDSLKEKYQKDLNEVKNNNQVEYETKKNNFEKEISEYQNELLILKKQNQDIDNEYQKVLESYHSEEERINNEVQRVYNELSNERKILETQKKEAISKLETLSKQLDLLNQEISECKIDFDNEISDKTNRDCIELEKYSEDKENQLKEREGANKASLDGLEENYKQLKLQLKQDYDNEVARYEDEYRLNQKRYLAKTREIYKNQDVVKTDLQNRLNELKINNLKLNDQIDKLNTTCEAKNREYEQMFEAEKLKWENLLQEEKDKHLAKLDALKNESLKRQQEFEQQKNDLIAKSETLKKDLDFEQLVNTQNKQKLEVDYESACQESESELARLKKENADLAASIETKTADLAKLQEEKEHLNVTFEEKRAEYQNNFNAKINAMNENYDLRINALDEKYASLNAELKVQMDDFTNKHCDDLASLKHQYEEKTIALTSEHENEIFKINQELEVYKTTNKINIEDYVRQQQVLETKLNELTEEKDNAADNQQARVNALVEEYQAKIDALRVNLASASEEIKQNEIDKSSEYADTEVELNAEIEKINREIDEVRANGLMERQAQETKMTQLKHDFSVKISDVETLVKTNRAENESLENRYNEVLKQVEDLKNAKNVEFDLFACELKNKLMAEEEKYNKQIDDIDRENCREYNARVLENKLKLQEYDEEIAQREFDYGVELQKQNEINLEKIRQLQIEHQKIMDDLNIALIEETNKTQELNVRFNDKQNANEIYYQQLQADLDAKKDDLDKQLAVVIDANELEIDNCKRQSMERLNALNDNNNRLKARIQDLIDLKRQEINLNNDNIATMVQNIKFKEDELNKNLVDCQTELNQIERQTASLKADFNSKVESIYDEISSLKNKRLEFEKNHADDLGKARRQFDKAVQEKHNVFEKQLSELQEHQEEMIDALKLKENIIIEKYKQHIQDIEIEYQNSVQVAQAKLDDFHAQHIEFMNVESSKQEQIEISIVETENAAEAKTQEYAELTDEAKLQQKANIAAAEIEKDNRIAKIISKTNLASDLIAKEKQDLLDRQTKLNERFLNIDKTYKEKFKVCLDAGNKLLAEYADRLDGYYKMVEKTDENKKNGLFGFGKHK